MQMKNKVNFNCFRYIVVWVKTFTDVVLYSMHSLNVTTEMWNVKDRCTLDPLVKSLSTLLYMERFHFV